MNCPSWASYFLQICRICRLVLCSTAMPISTVAAALRPTASSTSFDRRWPVVGGTGRGGAGAEQYGDRHQRSDLLGGPWLLGQADRTNPGAIGDAEDGARGISVQVGYPACRSLFERPEPSMGLCLGESVDLRLQPAVHEDHAVADV